MELLAIAVALAMDALAVAVTTGIRFRCNFSAIARMAFMFGFFQFMMPVVGWFLGNTVRDYIEAFDHWIAFTLLLFVGSRMIWESFQGKEDDECIDPTKGIPLLVLAFATSLDALAVGISMAVLGLNIWWPATVIGLVCLAITILGIRAGVLFKGKSEHWGNIANTFGGLVLIGIGLNILREHGVFSGMF